MDFETPVDGWHVWLGVALVSVGLTGFVLGLPTAPPPDAARAANVIDRVAGSPQQASTVYEYDANSVRIGTKQIGIRTEGGTAYASVAFGSITPIEEVSPGQKRNAFVQIIHGQSPSRVCKEYPFNRTALLATARETRREIDRQGADWRPADERLLVRQLEINGTRLTLVAG